MASNPTLGVSGKLHSLNLYGFEEPSGCVSRAAVIYGYKRRLAREISNVKTDRMNSKVIMKYYRSRVAEGLSLARITKCISTLKLLSRHLKKPFTTATKEDLLALIADIEERCLAMDKAGLQDHLKSVLQVVTRHHLCLNRSMEILSRIFPS